MLPLGEPNLAFHLGEEVVRVHTARQSELTVQAGHIPGQVGVPIEHGVEDLGRGRYVGRHRVGTGVIPGKIETYSRFQRPLLVSVEDLHRVDDGSLS